MTAEKEIKLYVFHYKPELIISTEPEYVHIWAGKNGKENIDGFIGDDTGDHISDKNKYYSELTGLYWIWKNTKADIIGSCHYRRFFTDSINPIEHKLKRLWFFNTGLWKKRHGRIYTKNIDYWKSKILAKNEIIDLLETYDAIMPVRRIFKYSVKEHYKRYHNLKDLDILEKILKENYPEYMPAYETILERNRLFANNMFILNRNLFDELMKWLFSVLFKFENEVNLSSYVDYQERIFGFLSERLITLWIEHNQINYKELPLVYFKKIRQR